jgi:hypothetical protein
MPAETDDARPPADRGARPGCGTWAVAGVLAAAAATVLLAAVLFYVAVRESGEIVRRPLEMLAGPQPTPVLTTRAVLLEQLREASELTSAVYTMQTVVSEAQDRQIAGLTIGRTQLLYVAHGEVRAGVDLSALTAEDVSVDDDRISVTLPRPTIQDVKIDVERSYVYDVDKSLFGPADRELQSRAERFALGRVREAACEAGILDQANERAALTVRTLLGVSGYATTVIETQSPAPEECALGSPDATETASP